MAYAKKVTPLDNYNIIVKFNTGETKIYNCYPLLDIPLYAKLKDKAFFMTAHIDETGLVCWDNATDIPPDELYNNSVEIVDETFQPKNLNYYMSLPYKLVIIPDAKEGGFTAVYPELPGCLTCAETLEQLVRNAEEAKRLWLEAALKDVGDIPEPSCNNE